MRALLLCFLVACTSRTAQPTPSPPSGAQGELALPVASEACTLETPLVEGVPGSPGHLLPSAINPNGQSELAALMRTMLDDLKQARVAIEGGAGIAPMLARHSKIRCAWPTTPSERNQRFDVMAQSYLMVVEALEKAPKAGARAAFNDAVDGCRGCHEKTCSGVLVALEGLPFSL